MREGSGATRERERDETVEEYIEETRETYNKYRMIDEKYETSDDNEIEYQTVRMYSEYKEGTVGMMKMNIKQAPNTYAVRWENPTIP
eukprot:4855670-Amphidinium_carterae.1